MNKEILKKIINYGIQAPSGDNSQPWKFVITKNMVINLYNLPEKDNPVLNIHQGGSLISHGAVILNIKIAADSLGYKTIVNYFPDKEDEDLIANFQFIKNNMDVKLYKDNLVNSIYKRNTNRRHYKKYLSEDIKSEIFKDIKGDDIKFIFFSNQKDKDEISQYISVSEEIILETRELHELLFRDIMWTKKQELKERHGLFVNTLEFNPIQLFVFWLCRKWKNISFLNKNIGFSHIVGSQNANIYKSSGLIGFILIPNSNKINYVKAGEIFQYIWLKSTSLGLSFQPVTGLFFLNERIKSIGDDPISNNNSIIVSDSYNKLKNKIGIINNDIILTSFRIGESKESSARSSRLEPYIIIE